MNNINKINNIAKYTIAHLEAFSFINFYLTKNMAKILSDMNKSNKMTVLCLHDYAAIVFFKIQDLIDSIRMKDVLKSRLKVIKKRFTEQTTLILGKCFGDNDYDFVTNIYTLENIDLKLVEKDVTTDTGGTTKLWKISLVNKLNDTDYYMSLKVPAIINITSSEVFTDPDKGIIKLKTSAYIDSGCRRYGRTFISSKRTERLDIQLGGEGMCDPDNIYVDFNALKTCLHMYMCINHKTNTLGPSRDNGEIFSYNVCHSSSTLFDDKGSATRTKFAIEMYCTEHNSVKLRKNIYVRRGKTMKKETVNTITDLNKPLLCLVKVRPVITCSNKGSSLKVSLIEVRVIEELSKYSFPTKGETLLSEKYAPFDEVTKVFKGKKKSDVYSDSSESVNGEQSKSSDDDSSVSIDNKSSKDSTSSTEEDVEQNGISENTTMEKFLDKLEDHDDQEA